MDETSIHRGHEYITVVNALSEARVREAIDERKEESQPIPGSVHATGKGTGGTSGHGHVASLHRLHAQLHGALRCALEPIRVVARMIALSGVINAATSDITNAMFESVNSHIQRIKKRACGFRSRPRFREALLFHLAGLDLYQQVPYSIHTKA